MDTNTFNNFVAWANQPGSDALNWTNKLAYPTPYRTTVPYTAADLAGLARQAEPFSINDPYGVTYSRYDYPAAGSYAAKAASKTGSVPFAQPFYAKDFIAMVPPGAPPIYPTGIIPNARSVDPAYTISPPRSVSGGTSRVSLGNIAKGALGITGLAAIADAVYNKDESALAYLLGMGPGSLVASTPLNAGENEQLAFMERQRTAEQAHALEPVVNRLEQQVSQLKPSADSNDLLNEAIKYDRFIKNAMQKGTATVPQEDSQIVIQGAPEAKPENDMEVADLDETPVRKSAGEITPSSVEVNTKTYDANGNLVSGSDPKVNTSKNTQKTLGTTSQAKGYITDGNRTVTVGNAKAPAKTSSNSAESPVANPPADATTVPASSKTDSSTPAKQGNFTRQRNKTSLLSTPELTRAILNNEFGNGKERIDNLTAQGYSPEQIQAAQDQINRMMRPVRSRTSRAPVPQRRISPTLAEAVIYNRPDTIPAQTPVTRSNTNASGYTKGHEAVFNPRTGRLEFI